MKRIALFIIVALLAVGRANLYAKTFETVLWTGSEAAGSSNIITLSTEQVAAMKAGDAVRVYITNTAGASYAIWYGNSDINSGSGLSAHTNKYGWVNISSDYEDVVLSTDDITNLSGQSIYIKIQKSENTVLTKVSHVGEMTPTSETELLEANWDASWTYKSFSALSSAKIGDVLRFHITHTYDGDGWDNIQLKVMDSDGNDFTSFNKSFNTDYNKDFDYEIATVDDLEKIQSSGFKINGTGHTLTSVKHLTYSDSYDAVSVTIGSDGIATWSHSKNLDFTNTGITAYYCSAYTTGSITLTSIATTWNYCGYILRGTAGTYTIKAVADVDASYPSATWLRGHVGSGEVGATESRDINEVSTTCYNYIFSKRNDDTDGSSIGFYQLAAAHTLGANKAYLSVPSVITPTSAQVALIFDDDETTDIKAIDTRHSTLNQAQPMYNLAGQKVSESYKGIVIKNGKKYVNK